MGRLRQDQHGAVVVLGEKSADPLRGPDLLDLGAPQGGLEKLKPGCAADPQPIPAIEGGSRAS